MIVFMNAQNPRFQVMYNVEKPGDRLSRDGDVISADSLSELKGELDRVREGSRGFGYVMGQPQFFELDRQTGDYVPMDTVDCHQ